MKGNYPLAVLHIYRTQGREKAMKYAASICKSMETMTPPEARDYVDACVKTSGHPELLDLYE